MSTTNVTGTGQRSRQTAIIQGHLMHGDVFLNLGSRLSRDVHAVIENIRISLGQLIDGMFGKIERGVRLAYGTRATTLPCHNAALENSLREFSTLVRRLKGHHQKIFFSVERYLDTGNASRGSGGTDE